MGVFCLVTWCAVPAAAASVVYWLACWPLVPKFAGSNPAEVVGFFGRKNPQHAFLRKGSKAVCPMSQLCGMKKNPTITVEVAIVRLNLIGHFSPIIPHFANRDLSRRLMWSASGDELGKLKRGSYNQ